jgi:hypothetical protein
MISGFNWGLIPSGATFQALANALLLYDDAKPIVFTKEGGEYGVSARPKRSGLSLGSSSGQVGRMAVV